jgi:hypothetical protein
MAGHHLTDAYLATLRRSLPADTVDELADGLTETYQRHVESGLAPDEAATTAIADFGTPGQVTAAFTKHAPGRRAARILLATGPLVGACWGVALVMARFWTWPVPATATIAVAAGLLVVVSLLVAAATSRRGYRRTRIAAIGGLGLILLDVTMPAAVVLAAPILVWPMALAIPASLTRAALTLRVLPTILSR